MDEDRLYVHPIDPARPSFAGIEIEELHARLATLPTRAELGRAVLLGMLGGPRLCRASRSFFIRKSEKRDEPPLQRLIR
jgi:hypothetical protein